MQRFGGLVNLNVHFHLVVPDGVFVLEGGDLRFVMHPVPTNADVLGILDRIMRRVAPSPQRRIGRREAVARTRAAFDPAVAVVSSHPLIWRDAGNHMFRALVEGTMQGTNQIVALTIVASLGGCGVQATLASWVEQSELHVDTSAPSALAKAKVELGIDNFQHAREVRVRWASMAATPEHAIALPLAFPGDTVTVPVSGTQSYALENRGITNAALAAFCQTVLAFTVEIEFPDDIDGTLTTLSPDHDLAVFCF